AHHAADRLIRPELLSVPSEPGCRLASGPRDAPQMNRPRRLHKKSCRNEAISTDTDKLKIWATIRRSRALVAAEAFTFVELLVVLAVIAALAATLLPAMAKSRPNVQAFQCLNNHRQL